MEYFTIPSFALISIILILLHLFFLFKKSRHSKLPPGPKPWPIIGNIHLLGNKPYQSVAKLSKTYGPLMSLKLGSITTIVISSPAVAKEMFQKHDLAFAGRQVSDAVAVVGNHGKHSIVWLPACPKWRDLKKILTIQLFTNKRLQAREGLRKKKVDEMVGYALDCCKKGLPIDIGRVAFTTTLNLISNTFFSMDLSSHYSSNSQEFKDLVWLFLESSGRPNMSDFFPFLSQLDLQGIRKGSMGPYYKVMGIFEEIIDKRLEDPIEEKDDVLGTLLKLLKENELSLDDVKHMLLDMFIAGTDTTSATIEWAMTELLRKPEIMAKAQSEMDQVVGKDDLVHESDISKLSYIQAVVKETLRLHPPAPFLIPHKAEKDVELCGYIVPKEAQVWVNVWSIGRDPSVWLNPQSFEPERFLQGEIDFKGHDFELIPFGAGRRICPGIPLAYRMLHLMLANLLHSFNWNPPKGLNPADIEVEEKFGLNIQKDQPLEVIPFSR